LNVLGIRIGIPSVIIMMEVILIKILFLIRGKS